MKKYLWISLAVLSLPIASLAQGAIRTESGSQIPDVVTALKIPAVTESQGLSSPEQSREKCQEATLQGCRSCSIPRQVDVFPYGAG